MSELNRPKAIKLGALALLFAFVGYVGAEPGNDNRAPDLGDCQNLQVAGREQGRIRGVRRGRADLPMERHELGLRGAPRRCCTPATRRTTASVGIHYAGPTWESASGSKVVAAVVDSCTPDPDAIPWLLLKAVSSEGPGIFHRVTYIQRVFTEGGLAPADAGDFVGEEARVPYTAWYVFYREQ